MSSPPAKIDCQQAQTHIRAVVGTSLTKGERMALRHHVQECEPCHGEFVVSVHTLAALGHEKRLDRIVREKALRKFELKRCSESVSVPKSLSNARLRTLVYPAFFAILMLALAGQLPFSGGPTVMAQGPGVFVRGHELTVDAGEAHIKRGEVMHTGPGGHALISVRDTVWRMRGQSALRLEGVAHPTMRLAEGHVEFTGSARCLTRLGIVQGQDDSAVTLNLDGAGLEIQLSAGEAEFVSASGGATLQVGQVYFVGNDGQLVPRK